MQLSAGVMRPTGFRSLRATLLVMVTCALFVLCAPARVEYGQPDRSANAQSMATMADMPAEDRREAMAAAARRDGTCGADMASNHSLDTPGLCTLEASREVVVHLKSCSCRPRETVISLHDAPTPNMLLPSVLVVNRCSGYCASMGHTCLATRTTAKAVTLFHYDHYHRMQCGAARVEEDTKCGCSCPLTAADCNERQVFRPDMCLCQCEKNAEFRRGCDAGRRWDGSRCRCVCETPRECSSGLGWSSDSCRCLRMMPPPADEEMPITDSDNSVRY